MNGDLRGDRADDRSAVVVRNPDANDTGMRPVAPGGIEANRRADDLEFAVIVEIP